MVAGEAWLGETPAAWINAGDVAETCGRLDERVDRFACRDVDGRGAYAEPGVAHHLGRGVGVLMPQVRQHDLFPRADAPGDCLPDRPCSDDDNYVTHGLLLMCGM